MRELFYTLSPEQEEVVMKYCNTIFSSGADTEKFFYRPGIKDQLWGIKTFRNKILSQKTFCAVKYKKNFRTGGFIIWERDKREAFPGMRFSFTKKDGDEFDSRKTI